MLAEAQIDRFMMKLQMGYPDREQEREIIERIALSPAESPGAPAADAVSDNGTRGASQILEARAELDGVNVDRKIQEYVVDLVFATRYPADAGLPDFVPLLEFGGSPRASIFLTRAARAHAYLAGRDFVLPDDVKGVAHPVFRHRLRTTYEADAQGIDPDDLIDRLLAAVPAP
jgi:MoxR-like ATPase